MNKQNFLHCHFRLGSKHHPFKIARAIGLLFSILLPLTSHGAVTMTNLVIFNGTNGANSQAALVQGTNGNYYGTTSNGGTNGDFGTVFQMTSDGTLTSLYSFSGNDGANPQAALMQASDGNFYGTTSAGGTNGGYGTIFRMTSAGVLTSLVSFGGTNGTSPAAALVQGADGDLYGTTSAGGTNADFGTVFKLTTNGNFTTLVNFKDTNGANPQGELTPGRNGNFYGTTSSGGTNESNGTVFRMTPAGALTSLLSFNGTNGAFPFAGLTLAADGCLYGTTVGGGPNNSINGTVFRITTNGLLTTLLAFGGTNGATPYGALILGSNGILFGTTSAGGASGQNFGTIFQMTTAGVAANLYSFSNAFPFAGLLHGTDGNFYGTTFSGGASFSSGTVFRIAIPPTPVIQSIKQNGNTVQLTWSSVVGQSYQVQYTTAVNSSSAWHNLGASVSATNLSTSATDSIQPDPSRCYRVALLP